MSVALLEQEIDPRLGDFRLFYGELPDPPVEIFFAETHMHVNYAGDDGTLSIPQVVEHALDSGLDVVALTGHNTTAPSLSAREFVRNEGLEHAIRIPVSEEVDSRMGHLGLIGIEEKGVARGLSVKKTISAGQEQGGIVIGEHFGLRWVNSMSLRVAELLQHPDSSVQLDGGEFLNGGTALVDRDWIGRLIYGKDTDAQARNYFQKKDVAITPIGGTDGHASSVGLVATAFWGCSHEDAVGSDGFERAVRTGKTAVVFNPVIDEPGRARRENRDSLMAWPTYLVDKYVGTTIIDLARLRKSAPSQKQVSTSQPSKVMV